MTNKERDRQRKEIRQPEKQIYRQNGRKMEESMRYHTKIFISRSYVLLLGKNNKPTWFVDNKSFASI